MTTATGPTARSVFRSARGPLAVAAALAGIVALITLIGGSRRTGELDPRAYDPAGAHALSQLLSDRGVSVEVIGGVRELRSGPTTTLVLPFPEAMSEDDLATAARFEASLLVVAPGQGSLDALGIDAGASEGGIKAVLRPGCALPVARNAGSARLGGGVYEGDGDGCYDASGSPSLYREGDATVVGSGDFLSNARLDEDGNAALALGLLEPADRVVWLMPAAGSSSGEQRGLLELLPDWFLAAVAQLCIAVVLFALWRARRLGRVVTEPLPVVVRAAEAVEGRGRLYHSARARDRAAEALRSAARDALCRRLSLGPSATATVLAAAAAERTGRPAVELETLLYGPVPADDDSLVRLAAALARLESEVSAT